MRHQLFSKGGWGWKLLENSWDNPVYQLLAKLIRKLPKRSLHLLEFQNLRV